MTVSGSAKAYKGKGKARQGVLVAETYESLFELGEHQVSSATVSQGLSAEVS